MKRYPTTKPTKPILLNDNVSRVHRRWRPQNRHVPVDLDYVLDSAYVMFTRLEIHPKKYNHKRHSCLWCLAYIMMVIDSVITIPALHYIIKDVIGRSSISRFIWVSMPNRGCPIVVWRRHDFYSKIQVLKSMTSFHHSLIIGIIIKKEFKEFNLPEAKNSRKGTRDVQESLCRLNLLGDERPRPLLDQHMERLVALRSACIILMYAIHRSCKRSTFHKIHVIFSLWASQQV